MKWKSYGVDDLDGKPIVVRARQRGGGVVAETVAPGPEIEDCLLGRRGVCGAALSPRQSFSHLLDAPFSGGAKARKVLPTLLDIQIPFPLEECVYAFVDKHKGAEGSVRVLAVGARLADVRSRLSELAAKKIDPNVLDNEGLALWTQAGREHPNASPEKLRVVLRLGRRRSTVVVGRGKRYLGAHAVLTDNTEKIARLLRAYVGKDGRTGQIAGDYEKMEWLCAGAAAADTEVLERIRRIPAGAGDRSLTIAREPAAFLARALAIRALGIGSMRCNLRGGGLEHSASVRRSLHRRMTVAAIFVAGGLLMCAGALISERRLRSNVAQAEEAFRHEAERMAGHDVGGAKGEHALRIVAARVDELKEELRPFLEALRPSLTREIVDVMTVGKSSGLRIDVLSITPEDISIDGSAPSWRACDELLRMLRENGYAVKLDRQGEREDQWIPFTIRK